MASNQVVAHSQRKFHPVKKCQRKSPAILELHESLHQQRNQNNRKDHRQRD